MHRLLKRLLLFSMVAGVIALQSITAKAQSAIVVNMQFDSLREGTAGIITLSGPDITGAVASVFDRTYPFFPTSQGYACLLAVAMGQQIQSYPITITITSKGGQADWTGTVKVTSGQFVKEDPFNLPADKVYLLRDDVQKNEDDRLMSIYRIVTPEQYWDGPLTPPVNSVFISPFGGIRTFNGVATRQHTGADLRAQIGTPVLASGNGRVVLSKRLDIHGNNVVIDHGWGVYTEYAHLSQRYVVPGQFVLQGDLIGLSGDTGRSTGPHLHWEIAVNGVWVDPVSFAKLKLPM